MPTSTEQIAELIRSNTELKSYFEGVRGAIDRKVADAERRVDGFIAGARSEYGHICISPNQAMTPNSANTGVQGLNHLYMSLDVKVEAAFYRGNGNSNGWSNKAAEQFGKAIGISHTNSNFNLLRVRWSGANTTGHPSRFHNSWSDGKHQGSFTTAAYIKVISGSIGGSFPIQKNYGDGWRLYGKYSFGNPFSAGHTDLALTSEFGEMLIALYGKATGRVDLENGQWGLFPALT